MIEIVLFPAMKNTNGCRSLNKMPLLDIDIIVVVSLSAIVPLGRLMFS